MKKIYLTFALMCLLIGACGCGMKKRNKVERMVTYINEKYTDDHFEYVNETGGHLGSNVTKIRVRSEKYPEKPVIVCCSEVEGEELFSDSYLNIKFEEETYEYLKNTLIKEYGENIYLKYVPDDLCSMENGSSNTTFKEYLSDSSTFIYFAAAVEENNIDEKSIEKTINKMFENAVVRGDIFFINSSAFLTDIAVETIKNKTYSRKVYIRKNTLNEFDAIEWSYGL